MNGLILEKWMSIYIYYSIKLSAIYSERYVDVYILEKDSQTFKKIYFADNIMAQKEVFILLYFYIPNFFYMLTLMIKCSTSLAWYIYTTKTNP